MITINRDQTLYIANAEDFKKALENNMIKLTKNGIALALNVIEVEDIDNYNHDDLVKIDDVIYVIEEATEGETVGENGSGTYLRNSF